MATRDQCCTLVPYFQIHDGKLETFKGLCDQLVEKTAEEASCLYYGFSFDGNKVHCREGYANAEGVLAHLENVGALFSEALTMADITRLEVHGPSEQLEKLRGPLADLNPEYWTLEYGFRH